MTSPSTPLPGDVPLRQQLESILRVDHAGEYGAKRIYEGQLAVLKGDATIRHMAEQEQEHLSYFEKALPRYHARPSALLPFWHVAGFALGAGTALLGRRAAMACTVAVESVIAEHYAEQIAQLGEQDPELKRTIETFRAEEMEHHDTGLEQEAEQAPFYNLMSEAIKVGCRASIWLAKRV